MPAADKLSAAAATAAAAAAAASTSTFATVTLPSLLLLLLLSQWPNCAACCWYPRLPFCCCLCLGARTSVKNGGRRSNRSSWK